MGKLKFLIKIYMWANTSVILVERDEVETVFFEEEEEE